MWVLCRGCFLGSDPPWRNGQDWDWHCSRKLQRMPPNQLLPERERDRHLLSNSFLPARVAGVSRLAQATRVFVWRCPFCWGETNGCGRGDALLAGTRLALGFKRAARVCRLWTLEGRGVAAVAQALDMRMMLMVPSVPGLLSPARVSSPSSGSQDPEIFLGRRFASQIRAIGLIR